MVLRVFMEAVRIGSVIAHHGVIFFDVGFATVLQRALIVGHLKLAEAQDFHANVAHGFNGGFSHLFVEFIHTLAETSVVEADL
jgi:hypothetical protein